MTANSIIRRQRKSFTALDNDIINDTRLGLKALGLLSYMLSKPNDWRFSQEQLGATWGEGRDAMRSLMKKLQECGYVRREHVHDAKGHIRTVTIVSELPEIREVEQPSDGQPASRSARPTGEPPADTPTTGRPTSLVKTESHQRLKKKKGAPATPAHDPQDQPDPGQKAPTKKASTKDRDEPVTAEQLVADGVEQGAAVAFLKHRSQKRSPLTTYKWELYKEEVKNAPGWTLNAAVRKSLARGWISFEYQWAGPPPAAPGATPVPAPTQSHYAAPRGTHRHSQPLGDVHANAPAVQPL